jgi:hypothetical protein
MIVVLDGFKGWMGETETNWGSISYVNSVGGLTWWTLGVHTRSTETAEKSLAAWSVFEFFC